MPGLTSSKELISRDEGMHTDFACLLFVPIVGSREYIFPENIGIFGDAIAGKQQILERSRLCWIVRMYSVVTVNVYFHRSPSRGSTQKQMKMGYSSSNSQMFVSDLAHKATLLNHINWAYHLNSYTRQLPQAISIFPRVH